MRRLRTYALVVCACLVVASPAAARRHVVERGETLEHIARAYGCTVARIQRANRIDTTLIRAGAKLVIPDCKATRRKVATAQAHRAIARSRDRDRARDVDPGRDRDGDRDRRRRRDAPVPAASGQSIGAPWNGELRDGVRLHLGEGFLIRRPERAWGASHVVAQVEDALAAVRDRFPEAHRLAIGDLSARRGGPITEHRSHQSGRDIDVGLYFTDVPRGYPESFVAANGDLDVARTFALLQAFARTADDRGGVQAIFLDFDVQGRLYEWARDNDVPRGYLDRLFQYPHGRGADAGLVRHEPHHADHFHVRYQCAPDDDGCR